MELTYSQLHFPFPPRKLKTGLHSWSLISYWKWTLNKRWIAWSAPFQRQVTGHHWNAPGRTLGSPTQQWTKYLCVKRENEGKKVSAKTCRVSSWELKLCIPQMLLPHTPQPRLCYPEDLATWAISTSHAPVCSCGAVSLHMLRQWHQKSQSPKSNCIHVLQAGIKWQHPPSPLHSPTSSPPPYAFQECCVWDLTGHTDFLLFKFIFQVLNYNIVSSTSAVSSHIPKVSQGSETNSSFIDDTYTGLRR